MKMFSRFSSLCGEASAQRAKNRRDMLVTLTRLSTCTSLLALIAFSTLECIHCTFRVD